jgi:hypothetical protein
MVKTFCTMALLQELHVKWTADERGGPWSGTYFVRPAGHYLRISVSQWNVESTQIVA